MVIDGSPNQGPRPNDESRQDHRTQPANDVFERNGIGLERYEASNTMIAEILRPDETGESVFRAFDSRSAPFAALNWFAGQDDELL